MSAFLQYLISGLAVGCVLALLGSGFVVIQRVTGVINFAQGTFSVLSAFVAYSLLSQAGLPHGVSEILGILAAGGLGVVIGAITLGRRDITPLSALVVTLGIAVAAYAAEVVIWGANPLSYNGVAGTFTIAGAQLQYQYLLVIGVTLLVFAGLWAFFGRTYTGRGLTACADNPYAARVVGIDPRRMGVGAFALGGLLGGIAGVLIIPLQPLSFDSDINLAVSGFAAAIFGGLANFELALAGGLILGVAESFVAGYIQASYEIEVALGLMLVLMVVQSRNRVELA